MARLLRMRFLDTEEEKNNTFIEVLCDVNDRRGYFKKINKEQAKADNTTIKHTKGEIYEVKLLGTGWRNISRTRFQKHLDTINKERLKAEWPMVTLPPQK